MAFDLLLIIDTSINLLSVMSFPVPVVEDVIQKIGGNITSQALIVAKAIARQLYVSKTNG